MRRRTVHTGGLGGLILAAVLGAVAGLWTWTAPGDPRLWRDAEAGAVQAHLLDNGFHTDLALPRQALEARGGPLAQAVRSLGPGQWILIGWGDARFYVDQRPIHARLPDGARAFFRPGNASVVMLDPSRSDPRAAYGPDQRRSFALTPRAFEAMAARIEGSLDLSGGAPRVTAARPGDDARFFASVETFWIGHLCNHWTASVLNAAGLPVRPLRAVTSGEVMASLDRAVLDTRGRGD
jgi:hypothetical protein